MTDNFMFLAILLHAHRNIRTSKRTIGRYGPFHWTFLSRNFQIVNNSEYNKIMDEIKSEHDSTDICGLPDELLMRIFQVTVDWIKSETNSIDIDYFGEDFFIHTKQYFDNGNFFIELKTDEYNQLGLKMPLNNIINEYDGSLKDVDDFIIRVGNEIYELTRRKKLMDKIKEKELQQH